MNKIVIFKKNDIIIVLVLLLLAAAGLFVFRLINSGEGSKVRVTIDGVEFGEYELNRDNSYYEGPFTDPDNEQTIDAVAGSDSQIINPDTDRSSEESRDKGKSGVDGIRIEIPGKVGICTLVINKGEVYMESADCPNQICVHHSRISRKGETIVCLPNRVVIEII